MHIKPRAPLSLTELINTAVSSLVHLYKIFRLQSSVMERGEKRSLQGSDDDHQQQQHGKGPALAIVNSSMSCDQQQCDVGKRPEFSSVMIGALTIETLQRMMREIFREEVKSAVVNELAKLSGRVGALSADDLQGIMQRVVREEVNSIMANIGPAKLSERSSPKQIEGTSSCKQIDEMVARNLQLRLRTRLSLPLYAGCKVEGEQGAAILIVLIDSTNGHVVTSGPGSSVKLDIVVLDGDFNNEESDNWTREEFERHVLKEREGKRPLLAGDLQVTLKEGVGTLGNLTFTDNSSWLRSKKFRLGLKVASGYCEGICVREGKTESFSVKDQRGELNKKHYPPALEDEVWRLEKIGKDGPLHQKLRDAGISNVEDFLRFVVTKPKNLRDILGSGMSNRMWDVLVEHAKTCRLNGKRYVYRPVDSRSVGVILNNIFEMSGFIDGEQYYSADSLSDTQKEFVDILVNKAYDNLNNLEEYSVESLLNFEQNIDSCMTRNEVQAGASNYPNIMDNQSQLAILPVDPGMLTAGSGLCPGPFDSMPTSYSAQPQLMNTTSSQAHFDSSSVSLKDQQINNSYHFQSNQLGVTIGAPPSSSAFPLVTSVQQPNLKPFGDWSHTREKAVEDVMSEEEIQLGIHEMLENEDTQHLLQLTCNVPEGGFVFQSYMPSPSPAFTYDEDRTHAASAVVSWLKIKAAMRWGFFIRKKAAERRAQIVEL